MKKSTVLSLTAAVILQDMPPMRWGLLEMQFQVLKMLLRISRKVADAPVF